MRSGIVPCVDQLRGWPVVMRVHRDGNEFGGTLRPEYFNGFDCPGVYSIWRNAVLLYIGSSKLIRRRIHKHWLCGALDFGHYGNLVRAHVTKDDVAAVELETQLIEKFLPIGNRRLNSRKKAG